jgi:Arc/MetJ family transcription regulator
MRKATDFTEGSAAGVTSSAQARFLAQECNERQRNSGAEGRKRQVDHRLRKAVL